VAPYFADSGRRMAFMVQQMASFGARSGESGVRDRIPDPNRYDYFAS
jgi:hypothetical protein